jgi:hypothetical protein
MVAPLGAAAVGLSASRGCVLLLGAAWLAVGLLAAIQTTRRARTVVRWVLLAAAAAAVSAALTSSMFFPRSGSGAGLSGIERRNNSKQTAEQNLGFRVAHDKAAIAVFSEHPLTGVGFESYAAAASRHLPFGLTRSPFVHNGYLQAAVDGGLLLVLPLVLCLILGLSGVVRSFVSVARAQTTHAPELACTVAALALLAHSAIDVDWTYPALTALLAALFATALATPRSAAPERGTSNWQRRVAAPLVPVVTALAVAGLVRSDQVRALLRSGETGRSADAETQLLLRSDARSIPDARLVLRALSLSVPQRFDGHIEVSRRSAEALLARSARLGGGSATVQMQRAQLLVGLGRADAGVAMAQQVVAHEADARPFLIGEYAESLAAVGRSDEAQAVLVTALRDPRLVHVSPADQLVSLTETLGRLAGPAPRAAIACALWSARSGIAAIDPGGGALVPAAGPRPIGCADPANTPTAPAAVSR